MAWKFFTSAGQEKQISVAAVAAMTLVDDLTVTGSVLATYDTNTRLGGNIPATYKHLYLLYQARGDTAAGTVNNILRLNNDSGASQYTYGIINSAGATVGATDNGSGTSFLAGVLAAASATAAHTGSADIRIFDYTGTAWNKRIQSNFSMQSGSGAGALNHGLVNGFWNSAVAITRLSLTPNAGNFAIGSRFSLYGIS